MRLNLLASTLLFITPLISGSPLLETEDRRIARAVDLGSPLKDKTLKILPLGDSITFGFKSSDGNGYRNDLLGDLTLMVGGPKATFIGSVKAGTMKNNENEGHSGWQIDQIAGAAKAILAKEKPNVVLVHAGTNDMIVDRQVDEAPERLGKLLDLISTAVPDALILVAQIIPIKDQTINARVLAFNSKIQPMLTARQDQQHKMLTARQDQQHKDAKVQTIDMYTAVQHKDEKVQVINMYTAVQVADLVDGIHPNDNGYKMMASTWYHALQDAANHGLMDGPTFS
ncbi:MAG: hypothetical protein M1812_006195 [Candelaria pacifica]|nr:MAG: hypothetical protein M1812_006195 [Candelaria pacifica]